MKKHIYKSYLEFINLFCAASVINGDNYFEPNILFDFVSINKDNEFMELTNLINNKEDFLNVIKKMEETRKLYSVEIVPGEKTMVYYITDKLSIMYIIGKNATIFNSMMNFVRKYNEFVYGVKFPEFDESFSLDLKVRKKKKDSK